ncbi:hypothetical protein IU459_35145 [Nocardia amamiensis]|uniref:Uncharacterized protein n=1 Tax=Nocardia amamiensis TaxID=404578 RepID=A0ABS0D416_9NOCA|nr:hypothetical protein [Nocardia amamiensis]MBF6302732.1 hypothetical protein [Nocardia amamiensis]
MVAPCSTRSSTAETFRDAAAAVLGRLRREVSGRATLSEVETARVLFLCELAFGSDLFGAGIEFQIVNPIRDAEAITLLRSLQRKLYTRAGAKALFEPELYAPEEGTGS